MTIPSGKNKKMNHKTILKVLKKNHRFLISTHVNPDPDALCSQLALGLYLQSQGKRIYIVNEEAFPKRFNFLPAVHLIKKFGKKLKVDYDVAVILDCGDLDRIGLVKSLIKKNEPLINIDHHITNDHF